MNAVCFVALVLVALFSVSLASPDYPTFKQYTAKVTPMADRDDYLSNMTALLQVNVDKKAERMDIVDASGDSDVAIFYFDDEGIFYAKRPDPSDTTCLKFSEAIPMGFTLDIIGDLSRFYPLFSKADDTYNYFQVIIPAPMEILTLKASNYPARIDSPSMNAGVNIKDFKPTVDDTVFTFDKTKCVEFNPVGQVDAWKMRSMKIIQHVRASFAAVTPKPFEQRLASFLRH